MCREYDPETRVRWQENEDISEFSESMLLDVEGSSREIFNYVSFEDLIKNDPRKNLFLDALDQIDRLIDEEKIGLMKSYTKVFRRIFKNKDDIEEKLEFVVDAMKSDYRIRSDELGELFGDASKEDSDDKQRRRDIIRRARERTEIKWLVEMYNESTSNERKKIDDEMVDLLVLMEDDEFNRLYKQINEKKKANKRSRKKSRKNVDLIGMYKKSHLIRSQKVSADLESKIRPLYENIGRAVVKYNENNKKATQVFRRGVAVLNKINEDPYCFTNYIYDLAKKTKCYRGTKEKLDEQMRIFEYKYARILEINETLLPSSKEIILGYKKIFYEDNGRPRHISGSREIYVGILESEKNEIKGQLNDIEREFRRDPIVKLLSKLEKKKISRDARDLIKRHDYKYALTHAKDYLEYFDLTVNIFNRLYDIDPLLTVFFAQDMALIAKNANVGLGQSALRSIGGIYAGGIKRSNKFDTLDNIDYLIKNPAEYLIRETDLFEKYPILITQMFRSDIIDLELYNFNNCCKVFKRRDLNGFAMVYNSYEIEVESYLTLDSNEVIRHKAEELSHKFEICPERAIKEYPQEIFERLCEKGFVHARIIEDYHKEKIFRAKALGFRNKDEANDYISTNHVDEEQGKSNIVEFADYMKQLKQKDEAEFKDRIERLAA